ncbi:Di-copper centre-containing protein [Coniochaeta ligniaria NRRL 30616]|uniref:Di-copper centre-containing protein n=1 Tax=Coniochaeta ligniaria NRRL 30616 TaxID=1408157 RepID=A0A1J7K3Z8_9PEZI|nr:Di-copper centre-containing protein [Coniochaeta ligniaria NRRL 30616]
MASTVWSLFLAAFTLASAVLAQRYPGYNFGPDVHRRVKRQISGPFVVRSLARDDGDLPLRQEIRNLEQNRDQWTLYLLGLSMMQYTNQSDPLSWYQITGIHGVPFQTWGGVKPTPGNEMSGYCTHISVLFPTWHRPYVSLYENILYSAMQDVASLWPNAEDRTRYQAAASNFRIPYWDWAANPPAGESILPQSIGGSAFVDVNGPNGEQRIANPLFSYEFKPLDGPDFLDTAPWDVWPSTVRAPTTNTTSAQSNNTWVEKALSQNLASLQQRLYNLFSNYGNFTEFSNEGWIPDQTNTSYDSLESVHDTVHNIAGGGTGHMAYIPFSAFDPVFFLHHANVDRLFAMWQALYPSSWVSPSKAIVNSYTTSVGQTQDSKTALTPFYAKTDGTFWDSDMVRDPKVLGYSYQEVAGLSLAGGKASVKIQSRVRTAINKLYGQPSPASLALKWRGGPKSGVQVPASLVANGRYREWIANVRVDKQALGGPFFIHLFLDGVPEDSATWALADNLVGTMSVFAAPDMKAMEMGGVHISGTVPLTAALKERVLAERLGSLEAGDIEPYLREHLEVGVRTSGGEVVGREDISSLHIHVASSGVRAPTREDQLPAWDGTGASHFDLV